MPGGSGGPESPEQERAEGLMGRSWDHSIIRIDPKILPDWWRTTCSAPKCRNPIEFRAEYRYITGRRGRISYTRRWYCRTHASRFCQKHKLTLPEEAPIETNAEAQGPPVSAARQAKGEALSGG